MSLRLLTYLSPSIPEGLFELVARAVERETGLPARLHVIAEGVETKEQFFSCSEAGHEPKHPDWVDSLPIN